MDAGYIFIRRISFVQSIIKTDQVVESDALLSAAHVFKETVICDQQEGAGVLLVIVSLSLLSVVRPCEEEAAQIVRERNRVEKEKWWQPNQERKIISSKNISLKGLPYFNIHG